MPEEGWGIPEGSALHCLKQLLLSRTSYLQGHSAGHRSGELVGTLRPSRHHDACEDREELGRCQEHFPAVAGRSPQARFQSPLLSYSHLWESGLSASFCDSETSQAFQPVLCFVSQISGLTPWVLAWYFPG